MWPVIGGLLGGLGSFFGAEQTNQANSANTAATNMTNIALAADNRNWQTQMSNTAYQRATSDMEAAGLNPMMMFGSGSSASTPSAPLAHVDAPQYKSPMENMGSMVNNIVSSAVAAKTMDKMTEEIANLKTTEAKSEADTAVSKAMEENVRARTGTQYQETARTRAAAEIADNLAITARHEAEMPNWLRKSIDQLAYGGGKASEALSPLNNILSGAGAVKRMFPSKSTTSTYRSFLPDGEQTFQERWGY